MLEDLHDADRGTLDLLVYLARHLAGTPLLMVGTYRDLEVDRAHPLAASLAEEADAIEEIYEPFLIQIGFLDRTPRGRVATHLAYEHFGVKRPKPSGQETLF